MRGSSVFRPVTSQSEHLAATFGHAAPVFQFVRKPQMAAFALLDRCESGGGVFMVAWHDALPVLEYEFQFGDWCHSTVDGVGAGKAGAARGNRVRSGVQERSCAQLFYSGREFLVVVVLNRPGDSAELPALPEPPGAIRRLIVESTACIQV